MAFHRHFVRSLFCFSGGQRLGLLYLFILMALLLAPDSSKASTIKADIIINGGSFSAPAAAFQAARSNPDAKVLLIEPTDWLGGQATSQGVSAIDNGWLSAMWENPTDYYATDYLDWLDRLKNPPAEAPGSGMSPQGTCWVSRESFDSRTGAWLLNQIATEHPNLTVLYLTVVKSVVSEPVTDEFGEGRVITGLQLIQRTPKGDYKPFDKFLSEEVTDWYDPNESDIYTKEAIDVEANDAAKGIVVIEASEMADVAVLSGAVYTVGREKTTEVIGEDGSLPEYNDDGTQSFVFPFCMTDADAPADENELKTPWADFDQYFADQTANYYSQGSWSWERIWSYRRLRTTGSTWQLDTVFQGDITMQNWYPGNDYPYGTMYKDKVSAQAETSDWYGGLLLDGLAGAEKNAVGWYFYMKNRRPTTWDTHYASGDDEENMMGTKHGLAKFPYIRGTRRIVGLDHFRITERYFAYTEDSYYDGKTSFRYYDSVGIGLYPVDIHPTWITEGISPRRHKAAPFYVPYRSLGSVNVRNLLASGKNAACTYITNAAYRLHPIEWSIGAGAGAAAALMHRDDKTNYDLLEIPALRELQAEVNASSPISWKAYEVEPIPAQNGDLIVNDLVPVEEGVPFRVEVYHHRAVRAEIYLLDGLLGETTTKANGRLVFDVATAPTDSNKMVSAKCYDDDGNLLDEFGYDEGDFDPLIIDNEDDRCTFEGDWNRANAQPDKYAVSYHYKFADTGFGRATFNLTIPTSGLYEIFVWYPEASNRATDAPFTVYYEGGAMEMTPVNQQENGGQWNSLGQYVFNRLEGGRVELSTDIADTTQLVVADAIRIELIEAREGSDMWVIE